MVVQIVVILIIVVMIAYVFGVGTDFVDDLITSVDDRLAKQGETPDPDFVERVNLAKDTGTRVCDLKITFFATAYNFDPTSFDPLEGIFGDINIFHGDIKGAGDVFQRPLAGNTNIFDYQWMCEGKVVVAETQVAGTTTTSTSGSTTTTTSDPPLVGEGSTGDSEICVTKARGTVVCTALSFLDLLSWNLQKNTVAGLEQLSLLAIGQVTDRERVEVNFFGTSINTGKALGSPSQPSKGTNSNPFTKSDNLPRGVDFPVDYVIELTLVDVTEDDYVITFWDNEFPQNGKPPGHRFSPKDLCKPGSTSC
jgi:hypothetical protein